jgi:transposase
VNPPDIPTAHKEKDRKADPVDAGKLARELEKGELKCVYIPNEDDQHLRSLCRLYRKAVQDSTRVKNRIKGHLYFNGVELPFSSSYWSGKMISHMESLPLDNGPAKDYLLLCMDELQYYRQRTVTILSKIRHYVHRHHSASVFHNLLTIPGIGFKSAITLYSEIIDINRFPNFEHLKSYVGLVPSISSSGEIEYTRGLTYRSNKLLKYVLIESAWVAIRKDPALLHSFNKLIFRMKKQDAIVRIAVKLLRRIRYVWHNNTPYAFGVVQ